MLRCTEQAARIASRRRGTFMGRLHRPTTLAMRVVFDRGYRRALAACQRNDAAVLLLLPRAPRATLAGERGLREAPGAHSGFPTGITRDCATTMRFTMQRGAALPTTPLILTMTISGFMIPIGCRRNPGGGIGPKNDPVSSAYGHLIVGTVTTFKPAKGIKPKQPTLLLDFERATLHVDETFPPVESPSEKLPFLATIPTDISDIPLITTAGTDSLHLTAGDQIIGELIPNVFDHRGMSDNPGLAVRFRNLATRIKSGSLLGLNDFPIGLRVECVLRSTSNFRYRRNPELLRDATARNRCMTCHITDTSVEAQLQLGRCPSLQRQDLASSMTAGSKLATSGVAK